ncbi:MAG: DNA recombination protein RmuC [Acidobacteria bacterium]|nr:DNA recombination protein RmuC [Acidobacteriota bacterium]
MVVVWIVVGIVVGALVAWTLATRVTQQVRAQAAEARSRSQVAEALHAAAADTLERERTEHAAAVANLEALFEATSSRVLAGSMTSFNETQERILRERDSKLRDSLGPLKELLSQYKSSLENFDKDHRDALFDVKNRTGELLAAQLKTQEETNRLNQLLGRSADRGRWGEVQLANVMQASGLRANIDFDLQVTQAGEAGQRQRPDCVVKLPNRATIVIDAKFPFANFEKALSSDDPSERRRYEERSASDLREHVKALATKSYWQAQDYSPEFTVCFVPSDAALAAAYEADPALHDFATEKRVLLVGPTNLLAMLWTAAEVLQRHAFVANAQEIMKAATELYSRIRVVAGPLAKLGRSLNDSVASYNEAIASVESRLIPIARRVRQLDGATGAKPVEGLVEISSSAKGLDAPKWGADLDDPDLAVQSEIIELEALEEADDEMSSSRPE